MTRPSNRRDVTIEFRDRCVLAGFRHKARLSASEIAALRVVTEAYGAMEPVTKADIDLAAGILGRLERDG